MSQRLFETVVIENDTPRLLILLHGTGGTARDFLFLNEMLNRRYTLIGLVGNVREQGMARFFRRVAPGVFDQDSLRTEAEKFRLFVTQLVGERQTTLSNVTVLGYSNGANLALATLLLFPQAMATSVLLHPMLPFAVTPGSVDLSQHRIFISSGQQDPMVSPAEQSRLIQALRSVSAVPSLHTYPGGHEITPPEVDDVVAWIQQEVA